MFTTGNQNWSYINQEIFFCMGQFVACNWLHIYKIFVVCCVPTATWNLQKKVVYRNMLLLAVRDSLLCFNWSASFLSLHFPFWWNIFVHFQNTLCSCIIMGTQCRFESWIHVDSLSIGAVDHFCGATHLIRILHGDRPSGGLSLVTICCLSIWKRNSNCTWNNFKDRFSKIPRPRPLRLVYRNWPI